MADGLVDKTGADSASALLGPVEERDMSVDISQREIADLQVNGPNRSSPASTCNGS